MFGFDTFRTIRLQVLQNALGCTPLVEFQFICACFLDII